MAETPFFSEPLPQGCASSRMPRFSLERKRESSCRSHQIRGCSDEPGSDRFRGRMRDSSCGSHQISRLSTTRSSELYLPREGETHLFQANAFPLGSEIVCELYLISSRVASPCMGWIPPLRLASRLPLHRGVIRRHHCRSRFQEIPIEAILFEYSRRYFFDLSCSVFFARSADSPCSRAYVRLHSTAKYYCRRQMHGGSWPTIPATRTVARSAGADSLVLLCSDQISATKVGLISIKDQAKIE